MLTVIYAESNYAECRYAECRYAECHDDVISREISANCNTLQ
jgi:hypothetical protein